MCRSIRMDGLIVERSVNSWISGEDCKLDCQLHFHLDDDYFVTDYFFILRTWPELAEKVLQ